MNNHLELIKVERLVELWQSVIGALSRQIKKPRHKEHRQIGEATRSLDQFNSAHAWHDLVGDQEVDRVLAERAVAFGLFVSGLALVLVLLFAGTVLTTWRGRRRSA